MKKNTRLSLIMLALCIGIILSACHHSEQPKPDQATQDTTQPKPQTSKSDTLGATNWTVTISVGDAKGAPYSGATVSVPCTGWPAKITNATGIVSFTGNTPCPCSASQATITTPRGCNVKVNVSCDSTYNVICSQ